MFSLLLFIATIAQSQIVNIPDANFKAKLLASSSSNQIAKNLAGQYFAIDSNSDGEIQVSEALNVGYLYVAASHITSLQGINSFMNLTYLNCGLNQITNLDVTSLTNLTILSCFQNQLSSLNIQGLVNLYQIDCQDNLLQNLDVSNLTSLTVLTCYSNLLQQITFNNNVSLRTFSGHNNNLQNVNFNNSFNLVQIVLNDNQLQNIDLNGLVNLENLYIENNLLQNIDLITLQSLKHLSISSNLISTLDISNNNNFTTLLCTNNPNLFFINLKFGRPQLTISNGYPLTNNPNLAYVCVDDYRINDFQNYFIQNNMTNVVVNSYCSFTPGGNNNTITGLIQYDVDQNGCDVLDFPANYTRIDVNLNGVSTNSSVFSNGNGEYNLYTSTSGVYNLVPNIENPSFFNVNPISADIPIMIIDNSETTQNFCITSNGVHPDLEIVITPIIPARPGFTAEYKIVYRNKGNQVMSQLYGINFFYNQNLMSFVSATQVPSSIVSGGMSWDFANLLPLETRSIHVVMQINAPTDTNPVNIDDVLQFTSSIMPMAGDEFTNDNLFQFNQTVVSSFDPNDITCIEGDVVAPSYIGEYLHYVINFENTGTAAAENVVVKIEVNPNDFDINTLRILESSHNATIKITNNILEIIFQTIMLDTGGHGNVLLKVKSRENLILNDIVSNNAKIYFDYNFPILTNDANTTFQVLSNSILTKDVAINMYPNPTSSLVNIKAENTIKSTELYDVQGRLIQINKSDSNEVVLDISIYNLGIYFIKVTTDFGSQIKKIVKE